MSLLPENGLLYLVSKYTRIGISYVHLESAPFLCKPWKRTVFVLTLKGFKEDSVRSGSKIYTWKNQSPETDPMTPELETHSIKAPINSVTEDVKILS